MKTYKFNPRTLLFFGVFYAIIGLLLSNNKIQTELDFATAMCVVANVFIAIGASFETIEKE